MVLHVNKGVQMALASGVSVLCECLDGTIGESQANACTAGRSQAQAWHLWQQHSNLDWCAVSVLCIEHTTV
jgi:hypothetical protein